MRHKCFSSVHGNMVQCHVPHDSNAQKRDAKESRSHSEKSSLKTYHVVPRPNRLINFVNCGFSLLKDSTHVEYEGKVGKDGGGSVQ
jgi:hypothetical protein